MDPNAPTHKFDRMRSDATDLSMRKASPTVAYVPPQVRNDKQVNLPYLTNIVLSEYEHL